MTRLDDRSNRRALLAGAATLAAGGLLAGCTVVPEVGWRQAPPPPILPSPETAGASTPTPIPGGVSLDGFLALSSVLTGFDDLDPTLGRVYLHALESRPNPDATVATLYQRSGFDQPTPPATVDAMEAAGVFSDKALNDLADTIITYWYTGIYDDNGKQVVATYVDALTWHAIDYLKPRTICGPYTGFWRERPPIIP